MSNSKFYSNVHLYLTLGLIIVFWGFSKSYFGRLGETALPYHVHGISATLWMVILIIQPYLYRINKINLHRYLGWSTVILVPILTIAGAEMMRLMIQNQANYPPNVVYRLAFIDALTLLGFIALYVLAIYSRKNLQLHSRFMVCTIFGPLNPAITRIFFALGLAGSFDQSLTYSYLLIELALFFIIWKERSSTEMRFTYLPVLIFTIVQHLLMYSAENWSWWVSCMNAFAGYR